MKPIHYLVAALVLAVVLMIFFWPKPQVSDLVQKQTEVIQKQTGVIQDLRLQNRALMTQIEKDSAEHVEERKSFSSQINGLKRRLAVQRPEIDTFLIDNPKLTTFIATQDSVIKVQADRIDILETNFNELHVNVQAISDNFNKQIKAQEERFAASQAVTADQRKQLRKERRKVKVLKVVTVISLVGGVIVGNGLF